MSDTITAAIIKGRNACVEHGFSFIGIWQVKDEKNVADGWDRYVISPIHISGKEYGYIGFVRKDGTYEIKRNP